jgi:hypothetical protein
MDSCLLTPASYQQQKTSLIGGSLQEIESFRRHFTVGLLVVYLQGLTNQSICKSLILFIIFGGSVWESKHALILIYPLISNSYKRQYQSVHVLFTVLILLLP